MAFVEEQNEAGASGLRNGKDPSDPQWCWQTISYLQGLWQSLNLDYDHYIAGWAEAEEHKVWEKIPAASPFGSKEEMLRQLELGDDKQAHRRLSVQPIARKVRLQFEHGGDRRSDGFQDYNYNLETPKQGTSRDYLLNRLYNQHYDIFERWERGEYRSVQAAAREAGIELVKPRRTVTLGSDIDRLATTLQGHYAPEQFTELARRMLLLRREGRRNGQ